MLDQLPSYHPPPLPSSVCDLIRRYLCRRIVLYTYYSARSNSSPRSKCYYYFSSFLFSPFPLFSTVPVLSQITRRPDQYVVLVLRFSTKVWPQIRKDPNFVYPISPPSLLSADGSILLVSSRAWAVSPLTRRDPGFSCSDPWCICECRPGSPVLGFLGTGLHRSTCTYCWKRIGPTLIFILFYFFFSVLNFGVPYHFFPFFFFFFSSSFLLLLFQDHICFFFL